MRPPTPDDLEQQIRDAMAHDDWPLVEQLSRRLDTAERAAMPQLLPSALWYAEQGIPVFPLKPGSKKPATGHGFLDATLAADQIRTWWQRIPTANIGLATGHQFDVIDIDGPDGVQSRLDHWDAMQMPLLGIVSTPRPGGSHLYIPPTGERSTTAFLPGIDYRGIGGYVVAPPSYIHTAEDPNVKFDGHYHWLAAFGQPRLTCRLHSHTPNPAGCWTCNETTKNTPAKEVA